MEYLKVNVQVPLQYLSSGQFKSDKPWSHSQRNIDSYELIIGLNKTVFIQEDDDQYSIGPGDVLLLYPDRTHRGYEMSEEGVSFYWVHFLCPEVPEYLNEQQLVDNFFKVKTNPQAPGVKNAIYIPKHSQHLEIQRVQILFHQLLHIAHSRSFISSSSNYVLTSLLIELSEQTFQQLDQTGIKKHGDQNLVHMLEWIRLHAAEDFSVSAIAEMFNYNKEYLTRYFKRKTGMNIQQYIHSVKLSLAKHLLTSTRMSIKEITQEIGMEDEKYFMKLFKNHENLTPSEYRKAYWIIHLNSH